MSMVHVALDSCCCDLHGSRVVIRIDLHIASFHNTLDPFKQDEGNFYAHTMCASAETSVSTPFMLCSALNASSSARPLLMHSMIRFRTSSSGRSSGSSRRMDTKEAIPSDPMPAASGAEDGEGCNRFRIRTSQSVMPVDSIEVV